jgi:hypothetical protein
MGNLGFLGFKVLGYAADQSASARRQEIVNEHAAKDIQCPIGLLVYCEFGMCEEV